MNTTNFNQTGGFPLETNTLDEIQTAYKLFNSLGQIAGDLTFISGGVVTGSNISEGAVYINGELLEFKGGGVSPTIIIVEEVQKKYFETGEEKEVYYKRYAKCGTGVNAIPRESFKYLPQTKEIPSMLQKLTGRLDKLEKQNAVFTAGGGMVLWNKPANQIPPGWREVTDWAGRMPLGAGNYSSDGFNPIYELGSTGGDIAFRITPDQLPSHSHNYQDSYMLESRAYAAISGVETLAGSFDGTHSINDGKQFLHYKRGATEYAGSSKPMHIVSPYRVVLFIEFIG